MIGKFLRFRIPLSFLSLYLEDHLELYTFDGPGMLCIRVNRFEFILFAMSYDGGSNPKWGRFGYFV